MLQAKTQRLPPKQNDNTYFHMQGYRQKHLYIYIYMYILKKIYIFFLRCIYTYKYTYINIKGNLMQVCLCVLKRRKSGGGIGGRAQRLPSKQNDNTYFHKQCYTQKHQYMSLYIYIFIFIYLYLYLNIYIYISIYRRV